MAVSLRWSGMAVIAIATIFGAATLGLHSQAALPGVTSQETDTADAGPRSKPQLDHSGKSRIGKASFYAGMFVGRKMADGNKMNPQNHSAASKTLPLGTTAKVTNLETGRSAVVTIEDRGPYVKGRIVDLTPATAQQIGLSKRQGVAKVEVAPITVPQPDGTVKLGAAARDNLGAINAPRNAVQLARYEKPRSRRLESSGW
ncbi:MAG: septal ring lytic transglycosylase RlpA family protein [Pseudomonadota bacterium]|nr:septal ring lytic transglycosylase RlpA family protein [Pseudomonadota bacterium]